MGLVRQLIGKPKQLRSVAEKDRVKLTDADMKHNQKITEIIKRMVDTRKAKVAPVTQVCI